jgi:hypothetical protein
MRITTRWISTLMAAPLAALLLMPSAHANSPSVTNAPPGQHGFPYRSSALNLANYGFVEEEFLVTGYAQAYIPVAVDQTLPADGHWQVKPNPGAVARFTTRILVRRPIDPARFNGTVIVEWINASGGDDAQSEWLYLHDEMLAQGYAYVGVTTQYVGVQTLIGWESGPGARYAGLFHPGDSYDYSIFAQAGAVVAHPKNGDPKPLGNLTAEVSRVLATGFSQSAWWLTTYVNAIQPLAPSYQGF